MTVPCHFCGEPVDPNAQTTYRRITGWERKALGGSRRGGSDIALRERGDEFACLHCVDGLKHGRGVSQGSLL